MSERVKVCPRCSDGRPICTDKKPDGTYYSHVETCDTYEWADELVMSSVPGSPSPTRLLTMELDNVTPEQLARLQALSLPSLHWAYGPRNAPHQIMVRIDMWGTIGLGDAHAVLHALAASDG